MFRAREFTGRVFWVHVPGLGPGGFRVQALGRYSFRFQAFVFMRAASGVHSISSSIHPKYSEYEFPENSQN